MAQWRGKGFGSLCVQAQIAGAHAEGGGWLVLVLHGMQHGAANAMFQLAHIAGPWVGQQGGLCIRRQAQVGQPQLGAGLLQKVACQHQYIPIALAQGRYVQGKTFRR